jgi:hypothetical protein
MHFSDTYKLLKKIANQTLANRLRTSLENLEKEANNPTFISYLKQSTNSHATIETLRRRYDLSQLECVVAGIQDILATFPKENVEPVIAEIHQILINVQHTAEKQIRQYDRYDHSHFSYLAKKYATHYLPFSQSNDPFKGSDFRGYCWGHSHRYGELAATGKLDELSVASDERLYETFKTNWTYTDILFRRVGWYFSVKLEMQLRQTIWNALKQLDDKTTLNFNFSINTVGFHSTSIRMVGDGVEYYENNHGLVKFNTRESAVNFLSAHLLHKAQKANGDINFITVYKLPYSNDAEQDVFKDVPQSLIQRESTNEFVFTHKSAELRSALDALSIYASKLSHEKDIKAKIKSNEIRNLNKELFGLPAQEIHERITYILNDKEHCLMLNRGSGFYFFASGFKSHSTTETLLKNIQMATCIAKSNIFEFY